MCIIHVGVCALNVLCKLYLKFCFEREKYAVIITSTTGEGEPPDTVLKFWRRIRRTTVATDCFSHLSYALLGNAEMSLTFFCQ
jgi:sulfite reductase alpha subunit-like flavoprotein